MELWHRKRWDWVSIRAWMTAWLGLFEIISEMEWKSRAHLCDCTSAETATCGWCNVQADSSSHELKIDGGQDTWAFQHSRFGNCRLPSILASTQILFGSRSKSPSSASLHMLRAYSSCHVDHKLFIFGLDWIASITRGKNQWLSNEVEGESYYVDWISASCITSASHSID